MHPAWKVPCPDKTLVPSHYHVCAAFAIAPGWRCLRTRLNWPSPGTCRPLEFRHQSSCWPNPPRAPAWLLFPWCDVAFRISRLERAMAASLSRLVPALCPLLRQRLWSCPTARALAQPSASRLGRLAAIRRTVGCFLGMMPRSSRRCPRRVLPPLRVHAHRSAVAFMSRPGVPLRADTDAISQVPYKERVDVH